MRIVIIEDDADILEILDEVFQSAGYDVITYPDKNSIKRIIINRPDLVLLDNRLKDGFGHDLCREIKENKLTHHIPVILLSAHEDLEQLANNCGADGYMAKPFDLPALVKMANHLAGKRAVKLHKHENFG